MKPRAMSLVVFGVFCGAVVCFAAGEAVTVALDFEKDAIGSVPEGWKIETVNSEAPDTPVATWGVEEDPKAPSGKHIFSLTKVNHNIARAFNLCWTDRVRANSSSISAPIIEPGPHANELTYTTPATEAVRLQWSTAPTILFSKSQRILRSNVFNCLLIWRLGTCSTVTGSAPIRRTLSSRPRDTRSS